VRLSWNTCFREAISTGLDVRSAGVFDAVDRFVSLKLLGENFLRSCFD
jgi:hypothetical protein